MKRTIQFASIMASMLVSMSVFTTMSLQAQNMGSGTEDASAHHKQEQAKAITISPHILVLRPDKKSATIEFANTGDIPVDADVVTRFAYVYMPHQDTTLFFPWNDSTRRMIRSRLRDTVIANPPANAPFAGRWLSGTPTHITLKPHETRQVTIRINPPASLPDGEYWARIVTVVRAPSAKNAPKSTDAKETFKFPIHGQRPPDLYGDSLEVFYRKGQMWMGMKVEYAAGAIDYEHRGSPMPAFGPHQFWCTFKLRSVGPVHFEGRITLHAHNEDTGEDRYYTPGFSFVLYKDAVLHFWARTFQLLSPGRYQMTFVFEAPQENYAESDRVPLKAQTFSIPLEIR